jgi:hypothetical protein
VENQNVFVSVSGKNDGVDFFNKLFQFVIIGSACTKDIAEGLKVSVPFFVARMVNKPVNPIGLR